MGQCVQCVASSQCWVHVSSFVCNCILGAGGGVSVLPVMEPGTGWQPGMCSSARQRYSINSFSCFRKWKCSTGQSEPGKSSQGPGVMFGEGEDIIRNIHHCHVHWPNTWRLSSQNCKSYRKSNNAQLSHASVQSKDSSYKDNSIRGYK